MRSRPQTNYSAKEPISDRVSPWRALPGEHMDKSCTVLAARCPVAMLLTTDPNVHSSAPAIPHTQKHKEHQSLHLRIASQCTHTPITRAHSGHRQEGKSMLFTR